MTKLFSELKHGFYTRSIGIFKIEVYIRQGKFYRYIAKSNSIFHSIHFLIIIWNWLVIAVYYLNYLWWPSAINDLVAST